MSNTGWVKSRSALDCFFTFMAEILQGYWQILDRSGKKIILLSPLRIKQTHLRSCYVSSYENDFFQVFKNANDSVNSVISNVLAVSLSIDFIDRFISLSSVIADRWNVLISLNLLKLRSAVLRIAVIGKLSLEWPQASFLWESAQSFSWGTTSKFCLNFSGCWRCNLNGSSRSYCSILRQ